MRVNIYAIYAGADPKLPRGLGAHASHLYHAARLGISTRHLRLLPVRLNITVPHMTRDEIAAHESMSVPVLLITDADVQDSIQTGLEVDVQTELRRQEAADAAGAPSTNSANGQPKPVGQDEHHGRAARPRPSLYM